MRRVLYWRFHCIYGGSSIGGSTVYTEGPLLEVPLYIRRVLYWRSRCIYGGSSVGGPAVYTEGPLLEVPLYIRRVLYWRSRCIYGGSSIGGPAVYMEGPLLEVPLYIFATYHLFLNFVQFLFCLFNIFFPSNNNNGVTLTILPWQVYSGTGFFLNLSQCSTALSNNSTVIFLGYSDFSTIIGVDLRKVKKKGQM